MKSELAEQLLNSLMTWDDEAFEEHVRRLQALALQKFDEYGNYSAGVKFFESLGAWLGQFEPHERPVALEFVLNRLVFISDAEMSHLVELVYPGHIEPVLLRRASAATELPSYRVGRVATTDEFRALRRRSLILGASDGARLDRLRRSAPFLSHEQFLQGAEPPPDLVEPMCEKLAEALQKLQLNAPATFAQIFIVDDFAGSGETMLRVQDGQLRGKLYRLAEALKKLADHELVAVDAAVTVIIYVTSAQARDHITRMLPEAGLERWQLETVMPLPDRIRVDVDDPPMAELCQRYYDPVLYDEHKGHAPVGYSDCALPVVLSHNTPNNSVCLLWADTTDEPESELHRRALFPRYERHHRDRP